MESYEISKSNTESNYKPNFIIMFHFSMGLAVFLLAIFTFSANIALKGTFPC